MAASAPPENGLNSVPTAGRGWLPSDKVTGCLLPKGPVSTFPVHLLRPTLALEYYLISLVAVFLSTKCGDDEEVEEEGLKSSHHKEKDYNYSE